MHPATEPASSAPPTPAGAGGACVSCGEPAGTPFCPACGERRASDRRYTVGALAGEAFEVLTNADSTIWRTFRTLVRHPGELTRAWLFGIRAPYMKPLQLFLVVNVVYFVWAAWAGEHVFDTRLQNHLANTNYGPEVRRLLLIRLAERGIDEQAYAAVFDAAATVQAKSLIITMVPMMAVLIGALHPLRRRPAVAHLVFSLHLYTVLLLLAIVQRYLVQWPLRLWVSLTGIEQGPWDELITGFILLSIGLYTTLALRRVYSDGWFGAAARSAVVAFGLLVVLVLYRMLLFYITFWST